MLLAVAVTSSLIGCGPSRSYAKFPAPNGEGASAPVVEALAYGVPAAKAPADSKRVLVVVNRASDISRKIAEYYASARKIPAENVVTIQCPTSEECGLSEYQTQILSAVRKRIKESKTAIDFVVLTKGIPMRIGGGNGYSVDAALAGMDLAAYPIPETLSPGDPENPRRVSEARNPFYGSTKRFTSKEFKMYLVCRLDGYEWAHIKRLIDNSVAAKASKGLFFFDEADNRKSGGYAQQQQTLGLAHDVLTRKGFESRIDRTSAFVAPRDALMGYASWGSNDGAFDASAYRSLRFKPGAIAETFVSTSGRTFARTTGGQSLIADLIEGGVTGVKGYVSEPYTFALCHVGMTFDYYTAGFNLAESFYGSSPVIKWKDIVIGDPLCNPYAR